MGRSYTPTYRVEFRDHRGRYRAAWNTRSNGRPTHENLRRYIRAHVESLKPGGANAHIGREFGISHPSKAWIIRQSDGKVVARYDAPAFQEI